MTRRHYVTTSHGQIGLCVDGSGSTVVVLAGLTKAARSLLAEIRATLPDRRVVAVEPPGTGGSAHVRFTDLAGAGAAVAEALDFLTGEPVDLVACGAGAALLPYVRESLAPGTTVVIGLDEALSWAAQDSSPPSLAARDDGTHLNALWSFLRDRRLVRADAPTLPTASGSPLPDVPDLQAMFLDAVRAPERFAAFWELAAKGLTENVEALSDGHRVEAVADLASVLPAPPASSGAAAVPVTTPAPGPEIWHQYLDTELGRVHLRRAGSSGRPVMVLPTGGGSSAQFAPVLAGLAETRTAVAMDYFGNGLSEALDRVPDIAVLAREAFAVADALGWDTFDVWGSHTGANVALEMAVTEPERIGRGVFEAPVMVSTEFRDDLLAHYFPDFAPDRFGLHLQHVWGWRRDMFFYWPWYRVAHENARDIGIPTAADLQLYAVGILESGTSYDLAYRAGFGYDTRSRLPHLQRPAILTAGPHDMLGNALQDAASLVPDDHLRIEATPATVWWPAPEPDAAVRTLQVYRDFLG